MKRLSILFLCLSLLLPTGAYACWDDEDDDITWDIDLPEIDVYPEEDYDWGLDEDWWRNDNDYDEPEDEDIQNWDEDQEYGGGGLSQKSNIDTSGNGGTDTNKRTASQITNAAKSTVAKITSLYGKEKAVCNFGVNTTFKSLFGKNDLDGKMANDMVKYWQNNPAHWEKISMSQAQQLANEGYFVVAGWINPSGGSGHVVVIVPGDETYSGSWGNNVPNVMDTGDSKRSESQPISESFGRNKKNGIMFFKYK